MGYVDSMSAGVRPVPSAIPVETLGESFTCMVERYQGPLIQFLYGMVGNREQAEDLAQDTLIKAYEAMERRRHGQEFTAGWLFRVARNTAIDALRRKRLISWLPFGAEHEGATAAALGCSSASGADFTGTLADRELIQQVLRQLPDRYRACLLLRTVVGLSNGEIAETLGISVRNVNTTLFRARERFRQLFSQLEGAPSALLSHAGANVAYGTVDLALLNAEGNTAEGGAE